MRVLLLPTVAVHTGLYLSHHICLPAHPSSSLSYVILLYAQNSSFSAPDDLDSPNTPVSTFNLTDYVLVSSLARLRLVLPILI